MLCNEREQWMSTYLCGVTGTDDGQTEQGCDYIILVSQGL